MTSLKLDLCGESAIYCILYHIHIHNQSHNHMTMTDVIILVVIQIISCFVISFWYVMQLDLKLRITELFIN